MGSIEKFTKKETGTVLNTHCVVLVVCAEIHEKNTNGLIMPNILKQEKLIYEIGGTNIEECNNKMLDLITEIKAACNRAQSKTVGTP